MPVIPMAFSRQARAPVVSQVTLQEGAEDEYKMGLGIHHGPAQNLHFLEGLWKITWFLGGQNLYFSWFWAARQS